MNKLTLIISLTILTSGCKNNNKNTSNHMNKDQNVYMINYNTYLNFSVFINDFLLEQRMNSSGSSVGGLILLNPFISSKGIQTIKIQLNSINNDSISKVELEKQKFEFIQSKIPLENNEFNILRTQNLEFLQNENSIIRIYKLNADVPYTSDEISLESSEDLSKMDTKELLNKVVDFYKELSEIINTGDEEAYKKMLKNAFQRESISMYYTDQEYNDMVEKLCLRVKKSQGYVKPLDDYTMYIHPNGKLVELRNRQNETPLYSKTENEIMRFGIYLHMPNGSNELVVY